MQRAFHPCRNFQLNWRTPAGEDWESDNEESRDPYPVVTDQIVEYLAHLKTSERRFGTAS